MIGFAMMRQTLVLLLAMGLALVGTTLAVPRLVMADASHADSTTLTAAAGEVAHDAEMEPHGDDHAAGGHAEDGPSLLSFDFGSAIFNLIIFLCVLAILSTFVWPSVLGGLKAREEKIREDLEAAEKASSDAKALLAGYELKLKEASSQVQAMLADARRDAEANGQKIIDEAKAEAVKQRERAVADIETAKKVAMADLATQTSQLAMQVARSVVGRELSSDDHADLIRQAMEQVPSQN